ncbi:alanine racemase [bacterium]|nr:alanine racemase [bacterium]
MASSDDSVLIAGKGHEGYQIIGKTKHSFHDRKVVQDYFRSQQNRFSRAWIEVNTAVIKNNYKLIFKDKPEEIKIMAVVKDDAVGHGMMEMARAAVKAGCSYLATACISEALLLRKEFEDFPILIFGERLDEELPQCIRHDFTLQVQSLSKAKTIGELSRKQHYITNIHLKVDTGMGRYGVRWDKAVEEYKAISSIEGVNLEGIMTHFAQSDEAVKDFANLQWQRFSEIIEQLKSENIAPPLIHACNTGGYLDLPHAHGNMVRISILPTGVYPSKICRRINLNGEELQSAMEVFSCVSLVKQLLPGDKLGYGMHFTAEKETEIAILPVGYGDGYPRLRNKGHVLIHGKQAPIIGGNGMDATMVNISDISNVKPGDKVVLLGKQGDEEITAMMLADWAGTVTYEILSGWTKRMDRVFVKPDTIS